MGTNAWAIGRDPKTWVDPKSFVPERFEDESSDFIGASYEYIPFGGGRRIWLAELPKAHLLCYFDWKLPNDMKPKDLGVEENSGATATRQNSLILVPTSHTPNLFE